MLFVRSYFMPLIPHNCSFGKFFLECTASLFFISIKAILRVSPTLLPFILSYYKCIIFWTHFATYFRAERTLEMVFLHVEKKEWDNCAGENLQVKHNLLAVFVCDKHWLQWQTLMFLLYFQPSAKQHSCFINISSFQHQKKASSFYRWGNSGMEK